MADDSWGVNDVPTGAADAPRGVADDSWGVVDEGRGIEHCLAGTTLPGPACDVGGPTVAPDAGLLRT
jgi:hypothetical protein